MQAGYGVWYGDHVPVHEWQSISRGGGGLRGVHVLQPLERLVVVLDSTYVFQGIVELSVKWQRYGGTAPQGGGAPRICGNRCSDFGGWERTVYRCDGSRRIWK